MDYSDSFSTTSKCSLILKTKQQQRFWDDFRAKWKGIPECPTKTETIGSNEASSDSYWGKLSKLILSQQKIGTASIDFCALATSFRMAGMAKSLGCAKGAHHVGEIIVLTSATKDKDAYGVMMPTGVQKVKYSDVSPLFAAKEGEGGCASRAKGYTDADRKCFYKYWDKAHIEFYKSILSVLFDRNTTPLIITQFQLLDPLGEDSRSCRAPPSTMKSYMALNALFVHGDSCCGATPSTASACKLVSCQPNTDPIPPSPR